MVAIGAPQYDLGEFPVTGSGKLYTDSELNTALCGPVAAIVFDDEGASKLSELLEGLSETEFESQEIQRIINSNREPEPWRVGEALAEAYLTTHNSCYFPWPDSRDERKSGSSLPGADLAGLHQDSNGERFAFAEVKTSTEKTYPPGTMYGRTGLKQQVNDLKNNIRIRDDLVRYLAHRATNSTWVTKYQNAAKRYIRSNSDVSLFGVLIRDVKPNQDDLRARIENLQAHCPEDMSIELLAVYLPENSIDELGQAVLKYRQGGEA